MRFFKLAIISAIVLFIIITSISLLLPSKILVSRAIDVQSNVNVVKPQFFNLANWQNWMTDAKGEKSNYTYNTNSRTLNIGETQISIIGITDTTLITQWSSSNQMTATFRIIDHHRADSLITVQWQMEQHIKWYPWQKFASITKDEIWGGSMEKSLENLKLLVQDH